MRPVTLDNTEVFLFEWGQIDNRQSKLFRSGTVTFEEILGITGASYKRALVTNSWLRVSGAAERPQIDQCVGHQFHAVVPLLFELKAQQQPLEFIFPREGPLHA